MSYRFTLEAIKMECLSEQIWEPGKDEMHLFGFGLSRKGHYVATGYRNLGSYHEGDVKPPGAFPMMLYDAVLEDDGLDVLFYFWFVEEDSGGVRGAATALEAEFRASYLQRAQTLTEIRFPRECIPFTAFYKAILPFGDSIAEAATNGANNDELFFPFDLFFRFEPDGPSSLQASKTQTFVASKDNGEYMITLRSTYTRIPVAVL